MCLQVCAHMGTSMYWYMCEGIKVCACMHTYTCVYILVYTYMCMNRCVPECACASLKCVHMCLFIYMFVVYMPVSAQYMYCTYVYIPMYVSIGVCMCELGVCLGLLTFYPCAYVMWNPPLHAMNTIG